MSAALHSGALGLFPSISGVGGVECSGRIAWNAVASASSGEAHVICYGATILPRDVTGGTVHHAGTQAMAVIRASSRKWPARLILVWHIGMLKLLPFIRARGARVAECVAHGFLRGARDVERQIAWNVGALGTWLEQ